MKKQIIQFWRQRTHAERRTLASASAILGTALLYAFVWQPLAQEQQRIRVALPQLRAAAAQLHSAASEVARLRNAPPKNFSGDLRSALEYASTHSVIGAPSQLTHLDTGRARISFNAIAFNQWIDWVKILQSEQGVRVESAEIFALTEPGMVHIQAVLATIGSRP